MKSTVSKEMKFVNDASRRLYRGATEAARKLETRLGQGSSLTELFSSEVTELRMRLKDYCERLIFADPVEYGKKAEDLLWRKVYYDFFWRCKQNRRKFLESDYHRSALKSHLLAGIGFYHHLLLRIQTEFHLDLEGKVDAPLLWHLRGVKKERWKKYQLSAASDENVQTWADQASHRILIYLGDLERYIAELDEPESNHLAERYYQQAFCINSENGTPHNQLGSLYSNRFDSAYHYMRCHIINGKPFWNDKLQTLTEEKDLARDRADSSDCISLRKKQAFLKKEILNAKRASFNKFLENFDYRKDGPKAFRIISALNSKQTQPCKQPMKRRQVRKREINSPRVNQEWDRLLSAPLSDEEFQRALQKLSRGKSAGPDGILPEFILELGSKAKQAILLFINKTWGGSFPSYWRKADVLPILKPKKDPTDIQSFRPISLTCIYSKIASVKWGSSQSVLTSTFTSYIRYELVVTASDSALSKLDIVQNKALRFITGAATSTPIASMQLQTEISSSSERRQYSVLSLGE
ncbi:protein SMG5 [Trichonephila clavipes]|nr:protein SMG5 [Trichonephila clavipes]